MRPGVGVHLLRIVALISPQLLVSAVVLVIYSRVLFVPVEGGWLHLPLLALGQCLFFVTCRAVLPRFAKPRVAARVFAILLWAKGTAINGVYLLSGIANFSWGENLQMSDFNSAVAHLVGLKLAFGPIVPIGVGALLVVVVGCGVGLWLVANRLLELLYWAMPRADTNSTAGSVVAPTLATIAAIAVAAGGWWMQLYPVDQLRRDPLFSFWLGLDGTAPPRADPLADTMARQTYPRVTRFDRKNVVIFIVDCMRADHLPLYGYDRDTTPFLHSLAQAGQVTAVKNAFSVGNESPQGIFGVLGSRYPEKVRPGVFTVYEVLRRQGYRTYALLSGDHSGFVGLRRLYGKHFDFFIDGASTHEASINDDAMILRELKHVPRSDGTPACLLFHLMSAHVLGVRRPQFDHWRPSMYDYTGDWVPSMSPEFAQNTYDNRLQQADDYLRRIWAVLQEKGYLRDYLAVVTGDHGEGLGEHGNYGHAHYLHTEDTRIPVLLIHPPKRSMTVNAFASQVDIAPTILDDLGLPIPKAWDGVSMLRPPGRQTAYLLSCRRGEWRGVIRTDGEHLYKYLCFGPANGVWHEQMFDLQSDPAEQHDLSTTIQPAVLRELRRTAIDHFVFQPPDDVLQSIQ